MRNYCNTLAAADAVGTTSANLLQMIRNGKLKAPIRSPSQTYMWDKADVERARVALRNDRRRKAVATATA
jgi:hypothetical protein